MPTKKQRMYFPMSEYEMRWQKVHEAMRRRGYDIAVIWGKTGGTYERSMDILYLTNFYSSHSGQEPDSSQWNARAFCAAIMEPGKEPELHTDQFDPHHDLIATKNYTAHLDPIKGLADALNARGIKGRVAWVGGDVLPVKYADQLRRLTPQIQYEFADDLMQGVRLVKSKREQDMYREGGAHVSAAMIKAIKALISGKSESEACALAGAHLLKNGCFWHRMAVAHGDFVNYSESNPLYGFSTMKPKQGDLFHIFIYGPIFQGYWFDPGRTAVVGKKPTREQKRLIEDVARIMEEGVEAKIRPGVKVIDVARSADKIQKEVADEPCDYTKNWPYYGHSNGQLWEPPFLYPPCLKGDEVYQEGMVGSSEAFLTRKRVGTAAAETNFIVTKKGVEHVTKIPMLWW